MPCRAATGRWFRNKGPWLRCLHGVGVLASTGYRQGMRIILAIVALLLVSCSKDAAAPAGNEQAVIDKANADVPTRHHTQYFEMFCNRGIYNEGWTAVTRHSTPWVMAEPPPLRIVVD